MSERNGIPVRRRRLGAFVVAAVVTLVGLAVFFLYRNYSRTHLSTDDAFVEASIHAVAPRVPGTVAEVLAKDNQAVERAQLLVRLDPAPFERELEEARASLRAEEGRLAEINARIQAQEKRISAAMAVLSRTRGMEAGRAAAVAARQAEVKMREASVSQARIDLERASILADQEVIPRSRLDVANTAFEVEAAALEAAREMRNQAEAALHSHRDSVLQAQAQLETEKAALAREKASMETQREQVSRRRAQLESAELRHSYTRVVAPAAGQVTRMSAEVGNTVQAGQPILSLVSLDDAYVVANYKETRIENIRPGQRVTITIDAYPGREFPGRVDSVMAGTGAAFSLFPPENASGNYVKVVQRVPVKITFDNPEEVTPFLKAGISVVPTILTKEEE